MFDKRTAAEYYYSVIPRAPPSKAAAALIYASEVLYEKTACRRTLRGDPLLHGRLRPGPQLYPDAGQRVCPHALRHARAYAQPHACAVPQPPDRRGRGGGHKHVPALRRHDQQPAPLPAQRGISNAEILYEIPAEGGVTRMFALFTDISDIESIGTVRSIRPYYAQIGFGYDAIIIHAGGSEAAYSLLRTTGWDHIDGVRETYAAKPFARDPDRVHNGLEHSLFADGAKLMEAIDEKGFELEHEGGEYDYGLKFSEDAVEQCTGEAEYARITFNTYKSMSFEYDAGDGLYYASQYDGEYLDENTGEQVSYTNLFFLDTDIRILDGYGRLEVRTTGEGSGWFCTGGKCVEITWEREDEYSPFHYYLPDGSELELGVGHTYVGIKAATTAAA